MSPSTTARRLSILAALLAAAACQDATPVPTAPDSPDLAASRAEPPQQALQRREAIFHRATPEVMGLPGTVFIDNDEIAGRVVVGVSDRAAEPAVRAAMRRMGVAEGDYAVETTPTIQFAATLRDRFRPTQAGIQIHFSQYVCTLGFNVTHSAGTSFITNSHCTRTQGGTEGTVYYQSSSTVDPTVIATEAADPQYRKGGSCPRGKKCRYSDASRALYASGIGSERGLIAKPQTVNSRDLNVSGSFTITAQNASTTNFSTSTVLNKVGRTTGWSQGNVTRSCVNTSVSGSTVMLYCQTMVGADVNSGDSGSPVFRIVSGTNVELVGILWGGASDNSYFVFSPLKQVIQELGTMTATR